MQVQIDSYAEDYSLLTSSMYYYRKPGLRAIGP
jgi:hypothetical protein